MSKGAETRQAILDRGFELASKAGLRGVTIGALAEALGRFLLKDPAYPPVAWRRAEALVVG